MKLPFIPYHIISDKDMKEAAQKDQLRNKVTSRLLRDNCRFRTAVQILDGGKKHKKKIEQSNCLPNNTL